MTSAVWGTATGDGAGRAAASRRGTLVTRCTGRPLVLMYHGVGRVSVDPFGLFVTPERFERQLAGLARLGLRGVSLGELGDALGAGQAAGLVALTFDDGYRQVLHHALPVLGRYGFTATVFAVAGILGGTNSWDPPPRHALMSADDLREVAGRGHEVGSHGISHVPLAGADRELLAAEVAGSRDRFEELVGVVPRSFCYPYGSVDAAAARAVDEAGYAYACAVWRVAVLPSRLAMPRIGVTPRDHSPRLVAKLFVKGR
ncbi:MAG: polysaccharide deacetylase [Mycobacterium sp.]|nr:polysaccharide deacetylase [Mycobacterium sp.]